MGRKERRRGGEDDREREVDLEEQAEGSGGDVADDKSDAFGPKSDYWRR